MADFTTAKKNIIANMQAAATHFLQGIVAFNEANSLYVAAGITHTGDPLTNTNILSDTTDFIGAYSATDRATFNAMRANVTTWLAGSTINMTTLSNQLRLLVGDPTKVV